MPARAWKATAPDSTGHRGQFAGNCGADRRARPNPLPAKPKPPHRHAAAARPPRGCAVGAARLRAGTAARLRVAAPYCELPGATRPVTGDTAPHGQLMGCQAERGGRRPEASVTAARRGETRSGSMRSTAERPRRGDVRGKVLLINVAPDMRRHFVPQLA